MDLSKLPLRPNPNGAPPNFVDPPSHAPAFLGVGISLMIVSAILLLVRIYANCKISGKLYVDDALCAAGWILIVAQWGLYASLVADGGARHSWDIPASMITESYVKRLLAQQVISGFMIWLVKACILALFIRIFNSVRWMRITAYTLIVVIGVFNLAFVAVLAAYCAARPGEDWVSTYFARASSPVVAAWVLFGGVVWVLLDCIMFAMPFPIIVGLQVSPRKKWGLIMVFAAAFSTVVAACTSLAYRVVLFRGMQGDPSWTGADVTITSNAEQFGTVIVSCAPGLWSFWNKIVTRSTVYSTIVSRLFSQSSTTGDCENLEPHRYASNEHLEDIQMKKYDPYPITNLESRSGVSEDSPCYDERFAGEFITSAIDQSTPVERVSIVD